MKERNDHGYPVCVVRRSYRTGRGWLLAGPWPGYETGEDLIEATEARLYCVKSPDHLHAAGRAAIKESRKHPHTG